MLLISLLLAVLVKQFWENQNPLHNDSWLISYQHWLEKKIPQLDTSKANRETAIFAIVLCSIAAVIILLSLVLSTYSSLLYIAFSCAVLLYSFGRGTFTELISQFIVAEAKNDWEKAITVANTLGVSINDITPADWSTLNKRVLSQASYIGFERFFGVVFWFALLGPVGAALYRITQLWEQQWSSSDIKAWLWLIEWPAVRALGLSYAITGNFASCFHSWKASATCKVRSSQAVLLEYTFAALSVDERLPQTQDVTRRELDALQQLLTRTLWFWLGAIALLFLM